ncbi:MAG: VOC family protein [Bryobacteraceae bacterium]
MMLAWYSVTDINVAKHFYGEVLGLKKTFETVGWVEFSHAEGAPSLGLSLASAVRERGGGATVVFGVDDLNATMDRLKSLDIKFEGRVESIPHVATIATFRDPFGNRLQIAESLAGKSGG